MKRNVLFLVFALVAVLGAKAQDVIYDWNFSDAAVWDQNFGGYPAGETTTIDGLSFTPGTTPANFGATNASPKTVGDVNYDTRMQLNGGGYSGSAEGQTTPMVNMPTQRYLSFDVTGDVTIDVVGVTGNNSNTRYMFLTDGIDLIGTITFPGDGTGQPYKKTVSYTGDAATLYLFTNQSCNIYEIIVTSGATEIVEPTEVTLTLQQPLAGGSITADPDQKVFNKGDKVTFTATAEENYTFKNFVVNGVDTPATSENTLELTMDEDKTVTAVFKSEAVSNPEAIYDWNFSDWDNNAGYTDETTVDGLTFVPNVGNNFGAVNASNKTVDEVAYTKRMQFNGAGYGSASADDEEPLEIMPTQRYLSFDVDGDVTVDIVGISGNSGQDRKIFLTDGTDLIGTYNFSGTDASKETVNYEGDAATLYLFCNQACNVYEIIVTGTGSGEVTDGISSVDVQKPVQSVEYFDIMGRKVLNENLKQTVLIKKTTYTDGTSSICKILTKVK